jgi:hypothetical protein|uniref:Type I neck protein n=1 Tax=Siphoviridae sp. ctYsl40 TaxID=2827890 RepID=A0A8S5TBN8_9CAUD|nr:MAG TPA: type I neck protein [Siphoviridae sp. ctYsl40]DAP96705.1 MAG TPA: type I neck protein [Caudoviricetes sp.]
MGGITLEASGSYSSTTTWLQRLGRMSIEQQLARYGAKGVKALASSTPVETGKTASSWSYSVTRKGDTWILSWENTNVVRGVPIAIILQYGHVTGTGGWVQGRDYINPAIKPLMDEIAEGVWRTVKNG